jgi:hypothetical protein
MMATEKMYNPYQLYRKGITVKQMIAKLKTLPQDVPFYVCSDEEQNETFKGIYVEAYADCVLVAGLSGCELNE